MRIATTTGDFLRFCQTDEERIRELHRAGFRYIDLNMYRWTEASPYMGATWRDEALKLRELSDSLGMKFVQAHSQGGNPLSDCPETADFILRATQRSIEVCEVLEIPYTVAHSGLLKGASKEEWFLKNKGFYEKLFETMERCGVSVLCENSSTKNFEKNSLSMYYFINTGKDMREFIDFVDHPLFGGCWDTGHANCDGPQYKEIMALGDKLKAIHYNDNHGEGDDEHTAPFLGTLNHDEVLCALIDVGFKGDFTLECEGTLREYDSWLGNRRRFDRADKLREPQLFMQRHIEKMMYETAEWFLKTYGLFEA